MAAEEIDTPVVSVIMPVYNGEKYLKEAIESVLTQTYQSIELIVINDGSADSSEEIIQSYGERIIYLCQANKGVGAARNVGIQAAKGEYIAFLDQDDWYPAERIDFLVKEAKKNDAPVTIGYSQYVFETPEARQRWPQVPADGRMFVSGLGAGLFKKDVFEEHGPFVEDLRSGDDLEWFHRLKTAGVEIDRISQITLFYRQNGANTSSDVAKSSTILIDSLKYILEKKRSQNHA
ncbi:MAG: glycosyltransferase family 2 protein [Spirosomaceae bacterium]|nr:glycosyltransferase family 2 protein [Spirosomataceae bacterium]